MPYIYVEHYYTQDLQHLLQPTQLWEGQVTIFCLKPVHVTYVALQSVPENTYHKFIFKRNIDRGPTVTTVKYFSLYEHPCFIHQWILPRGRFRRRTKPYTILFITLGRVIRTPPNFAWCLTVYTWRYLATQILQRSQDSEILQPYR